MVGPGKPKAKIGPKDADIIWRYDMMDELGVFPHNASNCSILIVGDIIIYVCTSGQAVRTGPHSNIPSPNSPSFIALDKKTGELLGEDDAKIGPHIFHGQLEFTFDRCRKWQAIDFLRRRQRFLLRVRCQAGQGRRRQLFEDGLEI